MRRTRFVWLLALTLFGCGNTDAPPQTYGSLLGDLTSQVIVPEHRDFAARADALADAVRAFVEHPTADSLQDAQSSWREVRQAFRVLDALHFGPDYSLHISERIDLAPADSAGIEALATGTAALDDQTVANAGGHKKGFLGLEYLLFAEPGGDGAAPVLAQDEAAPRRQKLALAMAHEIAESAHQLLDAWDPELGGFAVQLTHAGAGSTEYATQRAAVDAVAGGVGYALEAMLGTRLAPLLGKKTGGTPMPDLDATARSDSALADVQNTLSGVAAMYGGDGFSKVVAGRSTKLDRTMQEELAAAQAKLAAIPAPFDDALVNQTPLVDSAYQALQSLRNTWTTDVSSALGATVKIENDGD